jgi:hypothetical protein
MNIEDHQKILSECHARHDAEIAELKAWNSELVAHQDALADRCDKLIEQLAERDAEIAELVDALELAQGYSMLTKDAARIAEALNKVRKP